MFSRKEASVIKEKFWTSFGQYLLPVPAASGSKVNWINYKTGVKHIRFTMDANNENAVVQIEISHPDSEMRQRFFQLFETLKTELEAETGTAWEWHPVLEKDGRDLAIISSKLEDVNILNIQHWPMIISFLKPRMLGLDRFWCNQREIFEMLA